MDNPALRVLEWVGFVVLTVVLLLHVWLMVRARRTGQWRPMMTNQVMIVLAGVILSAGLLAGGWVSMLMSIVGIALGSFAVGRMSATLKTK